MKSIKYSFIIFFFGISIFVHGQCLENSSSSFNEVFDFQKYSLDQNNPTKYPIYFVNALGQKTAGDAYAPWENNGWNTKDFYTSLFLVNRSPDAPDNKTVNGWNLIQFDFGNPNNYLNENYAYLILYNKYRGILRVFAYLPESAKVNYMAFITLKNTVSNSRTAAFQFSTPDEINSVQDFDPNLSLSVANRISTSNGQWLRADFAIMYDPCTCKNTGFQPSAFELDIRYVNKADVSLVTTINGTLDAKPYMEGENDNMSSYNEGANLGAAILGTIRGSLDVSGNITTSTVPGGVTQVTRRKEQITKEIDKTYDKIKKGSNDCKYGSCNKQSTYTTVIKSTVKQGVKTVLNFSNPVASYALNASGVFDFFLSTLSSGNDQEGQMYSVPQTYALNALATTQGTIREEKITEAVSIQYPGTVKRDAHTPETNKSHPYYNNVMGVFALTEAPEIEYITYYPNPSGIIVQSVPQAYLYPFPTVNAYKLKKDVKWVINPHSGLEVKDIKASLVFSYENLPDVNLTLDIVNFPTDVNGQNSGFMVGPVIQNYYRNPQEPFNIETYRNKIEQNGFNIEKSVSGSNKLKDFIFGTKYCSLGYLTNYQVNFFGVLKNLTQHIMPHPKLKLLVIMNKKDALPSDPDIVNIYTYKVKETNSNNGFHLYNIVTTTVGNHNYLSFSNFRLGSPIDNWPQNELSSLPYNLTISGVNTYNTDEKIVALNSIVIDNGTLTSNAGTKTIAAPEIELKNETTLNGEFVLTSDEEVIYPPSYFRVVPQATESEINTLCSSLASAGTYNANNKAFVAKLDAEASSHTTPNLNKNQSPASRTSQSARLLAIPNPSYGTVTFYYSVPQEGEVHLRISNTLGQPVAEVVHQLHHPAGEHSKVFTHSHLPTGIYFYTLTTPDGHTQTQRLVVIK
ncbi:MAG: T9SS type A sorting domain-containing protein [Cytophagales bacterium]|nr:T9SS type A sorting domain-containing protein [Cytophagales bacterium]